MKAAILGIIILAIFVIVGCGGDDVVTRPEPVVVVVYPDTTVSVFFNDSLQLHYDVFSTPNTAVDWYVNNIPNGNDSLGIIDTSSTYHAPSAALAFDEVMVKAVSQADTTKSDSLRIIIRDRYYVYVDTSGSDETGKGTLANPYRTITRGISGAIQGQIVRLGDGTYGEGEVYPLIPRFETTVQGNGIDMAIVQAPTDTSAFRLEYESAFVKNLTIMGTNKQGTGIEFAGTADIDSLKAADLKIENCHTALTNNGEANRIEISNLAVNDCVTGLFIGEPADTLNMGNSSFANLDSVALKMFSPASRTTLNNVSIDNAFMGVVTVDNGFCFIQNSTFANIDSVAVFLNYIADLQGIDSGNNDFSGCTNWCVYNNSEFEITAEGNTWPASDSTTIDTQYIYDDDENSDLGVVDFVPFN
jgi:hypothetical protein